LILFAPHERQCAARRNTLETTRRLPTFDASIITVHLAKQLVFIIAAVFCFSDVAAAHCRVSVVPTVRVDTRSDDVRALVDTSTDELDRLAMVAGGQAHRPVFGMDTAAIAYNVAIDNRVEKNGDDMFCAVPVAVRILVVLTSRVIPLAHEAQSDDCLIVVREHERLHTHTDKQALEEGASAIVDQMQRLLVRTPLASANFVQAGKSRMATAIGTEMNRELNGLEKLRKQLDRSVD
jgi:hypothetical protein